MLLPLAKQIIFSIAWSHCNCKGNKQQGARHRPCETLGIPRRDGTVPDRRPGLSVPYRRRLWCCSLQVSAALKAKMPSILKRVASDSAPIRIAYKDLPRFSRSEYIWGRTRKEPRKTIGELLKGIHQESHLVCSDLKVGCHQESFVDHGGGAEEVARTTLAASGIGSGIA